MARVSSQLCVPGHRVPASNVTEVECLRRGDWQALQVGLSPLPPATAKAGGQRVCVTCVCPRISPSPQPRDGGTVSARPVGPQRGQEPPESPVCTAGGRDLNWGACHSAPAPLALAAAVRVPSCLPSARTPEPFPNTTNSGRVARPPLLDACPPLGGRRWAARSAGTSRGLADGPGSQGRWDPPVSHAGLAAGSLAARGVVPSGTPPGQPPPSLCASLGLGRRWRGGNTGVLGPWRSRGVPPPAELLLPVSLGVLRGRKLHPQGPHWAEINQNTYLANQGRQN